MDSLPSLHPIVLDHIRSPPFLFSAQRGLTFKGHVRESVDDLKCWLKNRRNATLDRKRDWWLAQLRLYGITTTKKMTKADMMHALVAAVSGGLNGPSEEIVQLENRLAQKFLLANAETREDDYATLSEEGRVLKYTQRFLSEKFLSGTNDESVMVFWIRQGCYDGQKVHDAAANLGLHSADARGVRKQKLIVVGKDKVVVQNEVIIWENE